MHPLVHPCSVIDKLRDGHPQSFWQSRIERRDGVQTQHLNPAPVISPGSIGNELWGSVCCLLWSLKPKGIVIYTTLDNSLEVLCRYHILFLQTKPVPVNSWTPQVQWQRLMHRSPLILFSIKSKIKDRFFFPTRPRLETAARTYVVLKLSKVPLVFM